MRRLVIIRSFESRLLHHLTWLQGPGDWRVCGEGYQPSKMTIRGINTHCENSHPFHSPVAQFSQNSNSSNPSQNVCGPYTYRKQRYFEQLFDFSSFFRLRASDLTIEFVNHEVLQENKRATLSALSKYIDNISNASAGHEIHIKTLKDD